MPSRDLIKYFKLYVLFSLTTAVGCNNDEKPISKVHPSMFNLKNDIYEFTSKLPKDDSLIIFIDASLCEWHQEDILTFVKTTQNMITLTAKSITLNDTITLNPIDYYKSNDSLSFEGLINYVNQVNAKKEETNNIIIRAVYKSDSLEFFSGELGKKEHFLEFYNNIMIKYYPNSKPYQVQIPEPELNE